MCSKTAGTAAVAFHPNLGPYSFSQRDFFYFSFLDLFNSGLLFRADSSHRLISLFAIPSLGAQQQQEALANAFFFRGYLIRIMCVA